MANLKITLVGGGSYGWGPKVLQNLLANRHLDGCRVVLHDLDAEALDLNFRLAEKLREGTGSATTFEQTTRLEAALADADYVVVTISTGGLEAMQVDLEVPEKYGICHTVGDTVGPGGLLRTLRNVPVFLELARDMERLCPRAWMVNCSNPLCTLTGVVTRETDIRAVGMCHGVRGAVGEYARFLGVEPGECAYVNTGIDHCSWFTELRVRGRCAWELLEERGLDEWLARPADEAAADSGFAAIQGLRCGLALGRQLGALPAIGDRHMVEFFPDFLHGPDRVAHYGLVRTSIADRQEGRTRARAHLERLLSGEEEPDFEGASATDDVGGWITALSGGPALEDNLNAANTGQIHELPMGAVVETRGVIDATGLRPLISPLPEALAAVVAPHVVRQEMSVRAAVEGSFDGALAALVSDPLVRRVDQARPMLMEMMARSGRWLPQFQR